MTGNYIKRKIRNAKNWIMECPYYIRRTYNRMRIKRRNFTVISNNCWAGKLYQYLDMPYFSPTIGLYFFAEDYLKFVSNLRYYFSIDLKFISIEQSKHKEILKERKHDQVPIGILDDIEIIFLHYKSEKEAKDKWNRRKKRINYDDIFIKFSQMNKCTVEIISDFCELPFENKFILTNRRNSHYSCEYYWIGPNNKCEILSDTNPYPGNMKLSLLLNRKPEKYPEFGL